MEFKSGIQGIQDLDRTFIALPKAMARKAYMYALRAGAIPVREAALSNIKSNFDVLTGISRQRDSIKIYNLKKYKGNYRVSVQVKKGLVNPAKRDSSGRPVRVALYLAVGEYGSVKLNRRPRSWIRKAIMDQKQAAVSALTTEMNKRMVDAINQARTGR